LQLSNGLVGDSTAQASWLALHDALADAIRVITPKEVCFALGITATYLSEALHGKNSKGFRAEWVPTVLALAPLECRLRIVRALTDHFGLSVEPRKILTPEQELAATREAMKRLAPGVLALVDKELGK